MNQRGFALDVWRGQDKQNQNVILWSRHNGLNQRWRIEYLNTSRRVIRKSSGYGKSIYNKYYGMYTNRPF